MPERFRDAIASNAEAADLGVQRAALELIWKEKPARLLAVTERVISTSRRRWCSARRQRFFVQRQPPCHLGPIASPNLIWPTKPCSGSSP